MNDIDLEGALRSLMRPSPEDDRCRAGFDVDELCRCVDRVDGSRNVDGSRSGDAWRNVDGRAAVAAGIVDGDGASSTTPSVAAASERDDAFARHVATCVDCARDLALVRDGTSAARPRAHRLTMWIPAVFAAAAVATGLFVVVRPLEPPDAGANDAVLHAKGAFRLDVAVDRGGRRFVARAGDAFAPGDLLGLFVTTPVDGYVSVLFADAAGTTSVIHPARATSPAPVKAGVELPLADGAVVVPGTGCEWLVAVFAETPFSLDHARLRLGAAAREAGPGCELAADPPAVQVIVLRTGR